MDDRLYTDLADAYDRSSATGPPNALYDRPAILDLLGPLAGRRVLELGCAAGHLTRLLVDAGAAVVALDRSPQMVALTRARVGDAARVEVADLTEPLNTIADESADLVVASLVLHYLPDWAPVLAEVHRCLVPGGALVLSVHHPITGWLRSDRANYHRIEEIEEDWDVDGLPVTARMWRRPVSAVFTPLLEAGLSIGAVVEPAPGLSATAVPDARMQAALNTAPVFLYVRASRGGRTHSS